MNWRDLGEPVHDVHAWRNAVRSRLLARREWLTEEECRRADARITQFLVLGFPVLGVLTIGFCWPSRGEVDPRDALRRFRTQGARCALLALGEAGAPAGFREWMPGYATRPGAHGVPVPEGARELVPDAVLVPMVGFGSRGHRLGYGGRRIERALASITPRPLAIGLAREAGRMVTIHPAAGDAPMDFIVTEEGIHHAGRGGLRRLAELEEASLIAKSLRNSRQGKRGTGQAQGATPRSARSTS